MHSMAKLRSGPLNDANVLLPMHRRTKRFGLSNGYPESKPVGANISQPGAVAGVFLCIERQQEGECVSRCKMASLAICGFSLGRLDGSVDSSARSP